MKCLWKNVWIIIALVATMKGTRSDPPEWPTYGAGASISHLNTTLPYLTWSKADNLGTRRLLLSNHPEGISGDPGILWEDRGQGRDEVDYMVYMYHQNHKGSNIVVGLIIENLSPDNGFLVSGSYVDDQGKGWDVMKRIGKSSSYASVTGSSFISLPSVNVPPATGTPVRYRLISWNLSPPDPQYTTMGAHVRLTVARNTGSGPVRCKLATTWHYTVAELTTGLPLIHAGTYHPRGSWVTSETALNNANDPFDLGQGEVRWLPLCQAIGLAPKTFSDDVVYDGLHSSNSVEARTNNGMYGVKTNVWLHVKNTASAPKKLGIYLRYMPTNDGTYVGTLSIGGQTKAVDIFRSGALGSHLATKDLTDTIGDITIPANTVAYTPIPIVIMNDGPGFLPVAIVLRPE